MIHLPQTQSKIETRKKWQDSFGTLFPAIQSKLINSPVFVVRSAHEEPYVDPETKCYDFKMMQTVVSSKTVHPHITQPDDWQLAYHWNGVSPVIGERYSPTTRWCAWDVDDHSNKNLPTLEVARQIVELLESLGFHPLLEKSSEASYHVWAAFDKPVLIRKAYRFAAYIQSEFLDQLPGLEAFPKPPNNRDEFGQSSLRLPGYHPGRESWAEFTTDGGATWLSDPGLFLQWLQLTGDNLKELSPAGVLDMPTVFEKQAKETKEKRRLHQELTKLTTANTRTPDLAEAWQQSRDKFNGQQPWEPILNKLGFVSLGGDSWARSTRDTPNASTQTGAFIVFGTNAAADLNLQTGKGYSKWDLHQLNSGCSRDDNAAGIRLMEEVGCWCGEVQLVANYNETRVEIPEDEFSEEEILDAFNRPLPPAKKIEAVGSESVTAESYCDHVLDIIETEYAKDRKPINIIDEGDPVHTLTRYLGSLPALNTPRFLIVVNDVQTAERVAGKLTDSGVYADFYDTIRPIENPQKGLKANCDNELGAEAYQLGFSVSGAVCQSCAKLSHPQLPCKVQQHRRESLNSSHLVAPVSLISSLPDGSFQDFENIITIDVRPEEVLFSVHDTRQACELINRLEQAGDWLANHDDFRNGALGLGMGHCQKRADKNRSNHDFFFSGYLPWLKRGADLSDPKPIASNLPHFTSWIFTAIKNLDFQPLGGADDWDHPSYWPILSGFQHHAEVDRSDDEVTTYLTRSEVSQPIAALLRERDGLSDYATFKPAVSILQEGEHLQHCIKLTRRNNVKRYADVWRGFLAVNPGQYVVYALPTKIEALKAADLPGVVEFRPFSATVVDENKWPAVCLGVPGVGEFEVRDALKCMTREKPALNWMAQNVPVRVSGGGIAAVGMLTYDNEHAANAHAMVLRSKLGNLLSPAHKPTHVICNHFTGLDLAASTIEPVTETRQTIEQFLSNSPRAETARTIRNYLAEEFGIKIDSRNLRRRYLDKFESAQSGVPPLSRSSETFKTRESGESAHFGVTPISRGGGFIRIEAEQIRIGSKWCHPSLIQGSLVGGDTEMSRLRDLRDKWFTAGEFAEVIGKSSSTAKRYINSGAELGWMVPKLGRTGKPMKGKASRYRWTMFGYVHAVMATPVEIIGPNESVGYVLPTASWDGKESLYVRSDRIFWETAGRAAEGS